MIITESDFRKKIKPNMHGCFVFFGEEDYLKSYALKQVRATICPDESLAIFNEIEIDFPDFSLDRLAAALECPPVMADSKLVVLNAFNFTAVKPTEADGIVKLIEAHADNPFNTFIINVVPSGIDVGYLPKKPSALLKKLAAAGDAVNFPPSTPARLADWTYRHFEHEGIEISKEQASYFVDYCGTNMQRLVLEIGKLAKYLHFHGEKKVTQELITLVCVGEQSCDPFALATALMGSDRAEALRVLSVMKFQRVKPEYALAELSTLFSNLYYVKLLSANGLNKAGVAKTLKLHEYKTGLYISAVENKSLEELSRSLSLCADADLAMKTYAKRDYEQIEKLVCLL